MPAISIEQRHLSSTDVLKSPATTGVNVTKIATMFQKKQFVSSSNLNSAPSFDKPLQPANGSSPESPPPRESRPQSRQAAVGDAPSTPPPALVGDLKVLDKAKFSSARALFENLSQQNQKAATPSGSTVTSPVRNRTISPSPNRFDAAAQRVRKTDQGGGAPSPPQLSARSVSMDQSPARRPAAFGSPQTGSFPVCSSPPPPPVAPKPTANHETSSPVRPTKPPAFSSSTTTPTPPEKAATAAVVTAQRRFDISAAAKTPRSTVIETDTKSHSNANAASAMSPDSLCSSGSDVGCEDVDGRRSAVSPLSEVTRQFNELVSNIERIVSTSSSGAASYATATDDSFAVTPPRKPIYSSYSSSRKLSTDNLASNNSPTVNDSNASFTTPCFLSGGVPRTTSHSQGLSQATDAAAGASNEASPPSSTVPTSYVGSRYPRLTQVLQNGGSPQQQHSPSPPAEVVCSTSASLVSSLSNVSNIVPRPYISSSNVVAGTRPPITGLPTIGLNNGSTKSSVSTTQQASATPAALGSNNNNFGTNSSANPSGSAQSTDIAATAVSRYEPYWRNPGYRLKQQFLAGGTASNSGATLDADQSRKSSTASKCSSTDQDTAETVLKHSHDQMQPHSALSQPQQQSSQDERSLPCAATTLVYSTSCDSKLMSSANGPASSSTGTVVLRRPDTLQSMVVSTSSHNSPQGSMGHNGTANNAKGVSQSVIAPTAIGSGSIVQALPVPESVAVPVPDPASLAEAARRSRSSSTPREDQQPPVEPMTSEEASVFLSPVTRGDCVGVSSSRGTGSDRSETGSDPVTTEIKTLPTRHHLPADVDGKRLSTCSIDPAELEAAQYVGATVSSPDKSPFQPDAEFHFLEDGHFWVEVPGLKMVEEEEWQSVTPNGLECTKTFRVTFSKGPIRVYSTFSGIEYDRRNEDIDPVAASAEYELERRVEKMDKFNVELYKGIDGLGLSIIGMGVGADAGLEKLGIFVKSITPGGAAAKDGRIQVCDQIVEVDGKSLIGVTQVYAAQVLRSTSGLVKFLIGRETDVENSEIAMLIRQSLEQDKLVSLLQQQQQKQALFSGQSAASVAEAQVAAGENVQTGKTSQTGSCTSVAIGRPSLPSTDSVFAHEDETPDALLSTNTNINLLMQELKEQEAARAENAAEIAAAEARLNDIVAVNQKPPSSTLTAGPAVSSNTSPKAASHVQAFNSSSPRATDHQMSNGVNTPLSSDNASSCSTSNGFSKLLADSLRDEYVSESVAAVSSPRVLTRDPPAPAPCIAGDGGTPRSRSSVSYLERLLDDTRRETERFQEMLEESRTQYVELERKYCKAKKVIKDYQEREKEMLEREEEHLIKLRAKDEEYNSLIKRLKDKVHLLELQLTDAKLEENSFRSGGGSFGGIDSNIISPAHDFVPASLAYQPVKKLEADISDLDSPPDEKSSDKRDSSNFSSSLTPLSNSSIASTPLLLTSSSNVDTGSRCKLINSNSYMATPVVSNIMQAPAARRQLHDVGVPATELLDSTVVKSKLDVIKNSNVMNNRQPPTCIRRTFETEVPIHCCHSLGPFSPLGSSGHAHCTFNEMTPGSAQPATSCGSSLSPDISAAATDSFAANQSSTSSPAKSSDQTNSVCGSTPNQSPQPAKKLLSSARFAMLGGHSIKHRADVNQTIKFLAELEFTPLQVNGWSCEDVCKFLYSISLDKYTPEFTVNKIDGPKLLQLDGTKLKSMGVHVHADRSSLKRRIKDIRSAIEKEKKQQEKEAKVRQKLEKRSGSVKKK